MEEKELRVAKIKSILKYLNNLYDFYTPKHR
jgi:hypothetical protein